MIKPRKHIKYQNIACPICKQESFNLLNTRSKQIETKNFIFVFNNNEGCCKNCSFIFTNPMPLQKSLNDYYRDKSPHIGSPDYNMKNRINLINQIMIPQYETMVEIGSNNGIFVNECKNIINNAYGVELGDEKNQKKLGSINNKSIDILVMNHVLEHIPEIINYLKLSRSKLRDNGKIICEVPVLEKYSNNISALYHEHLFHFTKQTLCTVFELAGFRIEKFYSNKYLSRPVGSIVVASIGNEVNKVKIKDNVSKKYFSDALTNEKKVIQRQLDFINDIFVNSNQNIGIWGVNEYLDIILDTVSKKEIKRIHVFDKSTLKQGSHYGAGENTVIVQDPKNYNKLKNLSKVVICAVSWKNEIRNELISLGINYNDVKTFPY